VAFEPDAHYIAAADKKRIIGIKLHRGSDCGESHAVVRQNSFAKWQNAHIDNWTPEQYMN